MLQPDKTSAGLVEIAARALAPDAFSEDWEEPARRCLEAIVPYVAQTLRAEVQANGPIGRHVAGDEALRIARVLLEVDALSREDRS